MQRSGRFRLCRNHLVRSEKARRRAGFHLAQRVKVREAVQPLKRGDVRPYITPRRRGAANRLWRFRLLKNAYHKNGSKNCWNSVPLRLIFAYNVKEREASFAFVALERNPLQGLWMSF